MNSQLEGFREVVENRSVPELVLKTLPLLFLVASIYFSLAPGQTDNGQSDTVTVTLDSSRYPFKIGKRQRGSTVLEGNKLSVRPNGSIDYWESPTFQLVELERLVVEMEKGENDLATVKLKSSVNPEFERNGSYYAAETVTWELDNGANTFHITDEENDRLRKYVRVFFSLKDRDGDGQPVVESYRLTGERYPSDLLMIYSY